MGNILQAMTACNPLLQTMLGGKYDHVHRHCKSKCTDLCTIDYETDKSVSDDNESELSVDVEKTHFEGSLYNTSKSRHQRHYST